MKRLEVAGEAQPYLSFALIVRNAADTLEPCLRSLRDRAPDAEIVVVDTCSGDLPTALESNEGPFDLRYPKTHQIAQKYADVFEEYKGPQGDWNREMFAFSDAAAARNRSFELCNGKWICWVDADDIIAGPEEAERLLKLNARWMPGPAHAVKDRELKGPVSLAELLRFVDEKVPQTEGFKCPYLYQSRPDGTAITWQERERIVRNNKKWHWQRPAHEILVPKNVTDYSQLHTLSHLLFVHKKKFTQEETYFSLKRHFDILIKEYNSGVRHLQGLLYLENFSIFLCPERRGEFIKAAYEASATNVDRARALIRAGNFAAEQGFYWDAIEAFNGAVAIAPDFPDSWAAGASTYDKAENPLKAAEWWLRAIACPTDCTVSDINPRAQVIELRLRAALSLLKGARAQSACGKVKEAGPTLELAVATIRAAAEHPAIGEDRPEALSYMNLIQNELDGIRALVGLKFAHEYLIRNDETQKAAQLLNVVPHNLKDHPYTIGMERWAKLVNTHLTDTEAYRKFYDEIGTDIVSIEGGFTYDTCLPRVGFLIDALRKMGDGPIRLLEVGSFDGITALPVLRECPNVSYTAVETKLDALQRLHERAQKYGVADRLSSMHGLLIDDKQFAHSFDVVVFHEVIEHVPNVRESLVALLQYLKPTGRLFVSTPWGAFDRGFPPPDRDPRGHVRAFSVRELVEAVDNAGATVVELGGAHTNANYGDTIHLTARLGGTSRGASFLVSAALWDWNATHVEQTGIGASEETIVGLARYIGRLGRKTEVFGPLPVHESLVLEEVRDSVRYWPREQMRLLDPGQTAVISRAPGFGAKLDHPDKVLWLQDAAYPDLNAEVAAEYRKVVVLTEWHKTVMNVNHGVPLDKMVIAENFLLAEHFSKEGAPERKRNKFVYASSPDRGLINLLKLWPRIREAIPDAELHIFYGWEGCIKLAAFADPSWTSRYRKIRTQFLELRYQPGIVERGRVNHVTLAREFQSAAAWLYPTGFDESGCLTAAKSLAGGCVPVCTPRAALNETARSNITQFVCMPPGMDPYSDGLGVETHPDWNTYAELFLAGVRNAVEVSDAWREQASLASIEHFRIESIWPIWRDVLSQ